MLSGWRGCRDCCEYHVQALVSECRVSSPSWDQDGQIWQAEGERGSNVVLSPPQAWQGQLVTLYSLSPEGN